MDEEEELEDELRKLDIKEDLGNEDSDATPTNTPTPSTPPTIVHLPYSSNTSGFFDGDFRYSSCDDYDMRTDSSLSWGEDEFEGEATRIVNALFSQLDQIIYDDFAFLPAQFPLLKSWKSRTKSKPNSLERRLPQKYASESNLYRPPLQSQISSTSDISEDEAYDSASKKGLDLAPPSNDLTAECKEWMLNFPHFRVSGIGINPLNYDSIESNLLADSTEDSLKEENTEEVIAIDGDYENKLPFLTLKSVVSKDKKKEKRAKGPPSRICSGSADPDLLREHTLIKVFDHLWPAVSQIIEPLLNQYAQFMINRSVQYSSFSRGSSTRGERELPHIVGNELKRHGVAKSLETFPSIGWSGNRTLVNSRPSSAVQRLPPRMPIKNLVGEDFSALLQVSSKPLLFGPRREGRSFSASRTRDLSASSITSLPSLPSLGHLHRPVSSRSGNHLLTPMPTAEQRPMSTSSFTRLRYNDKFSKLNRTATIEEGGASDKGKDSDLRPGNISPTWSRHNSFLPQIKDSKTKTSPSALNVSGKSLSARSGNGKGILSSPRRGANSFLVTDRL